MLTGEQDFKSVNLSVLLGKGDGAFRTPVIDLLLPSVPGPAGLSGNNVRQGHRRLPAARIAHAPTDGEVIGSGDFNQGCQVFAADLNGDGKRDLFMVDFQDAPGGAISALINKSKQHSHRRHVPQEIRRPHAIAGTAWLDKRKPFMAKGPSCRYPTLGRDDEACAI